MLTCLPFDILTKIFQHAGQSARVKCSRACKILKTACEDPRSWPDLALCSYSPTAAEFVCHVKPQTLVLHNFDEAELELLIDKLDRRTCTTITDLTLPSLFKDLHHIFPNIHTIQVTVIPHRSHYPYLLPMKHLSHLTMAVCEGMKLKQLWNNLDSLKTLELRLHGTLFIKHLPPNLEQLILVIETGPRVDIVFSLCRNLNLKVHCDHLLVTLGFTAVPDSSAWARWILERQPEWPATAFIELDPE